MGCCKKKSECPPPRPPPPPRTHSPPPPVPPPPPGKHFVEEHSKASSKHVRIAEPAKSTASKASKGSKGEPKAHSTPVQNLHITQPNNSSGETTQVILPTIDIQTNPNGGPGYIRVQGGINTSRWHNYEGYLPAKDFLDAEPAQQANLINAMIASQVGHPAQLNTYNQPQIISGRISEIPAPAILPAPAETPAPPLTVANLRKASTKAPSDALTSVSRAPRRHSSPKTHHPIAISEPSSTSAAPTTKVKTKKLRCCSCGEADRSGLHAVRNFRGSVPLCLKCVMKADGGNAVAQWLNSSG